MTKDALGPSSLPDTLSSHLLAQLSLEGPQSWPRHCQPHHPRHVSKNPRAQGPHPLQFGTRLLTDPSAVFSHNAWDHIETDASYQAPAAASIVLQRSHPVYA